MATYYERSTLYHNWKCKDQDCSICLPVQKAIKRTALNPVGKASAQREISQGIIVETTQQSMQFQCLMSEVEQLRSQASTNASLTYNEKIDLVNKIQSLPPDKFTEIANIIKEEFLSTSRVLAMILYIRHCHITAAEHHIRGFRYS